jgi:hypothetical protein
MSDIVDFAAYRAAHRPAEPVDHLALSRESLAQALAALRGTTVAEARATFKGTTDDSDEEATLKHDQEATTRALSALRELCRPQALRAAGLSVPEPPART